MEDLKEQGVECKPLVWSCWGREHADTSAVLLAVARRAARRRGLANHWVLLQARGHIGAALAWRTGATLLACRDWS